MSQTFDTLNLPSGLIENLYDLGYSEMTEIQQKSLPVSLSGKDLIAQAKTGSGKTAAFGIPLLVKVDVQDFTPQALILCPTRELADQVAKELRRLARYRHNVKILTLCGGMPMRPQMHSLEHGAHIVVGTPGRILDHLSKKTLILDKIKTVVLDEADRMLDMGFYEDIEKIINRTKRERQTLLFSATFPSEIEILSKDFMQTPKRIKTESKHSENVIEEIFYKADDIAETLLQILRYYQPESAIVFANTKIEVMDLTDILIDAGFSALDLHGDLEQQDRTQVLLQFANRSIRILVATDVAARGLDIKEVEMVINAQLPRKKEDYLHRIGRTARAGKKGTAVTLFTSREQKKLSEFTEKTPVFAEELHIDETVQLPAKMKTICIHGGKKNKLRAGDILGALCRDIGLAKDAVGKIDIFDFYAYVAVERGQFTKALNGLETGKIKGKKFKVWAL